MYVYLVSPNAPILSSIHPFLNSAVALNVTVWVWIALLHLLFSWIAAQIREIDCQALYTFNQVLHICTFFSLSYLFGEPVLRKFCHWSCEHQSFPANVCWWKQLRIHPLFNHYFSMAVWSRRWFIVGPLIVIILGHWSLLLHGMESLILFLSRFLRIFRHRRPFEGYLGTWSRLCHYWNRQQASSGHVYIFNGVRFDRLVVNGL